ncbi:MAG: hypothetical protein DRJ14_07980, partial [Acidobacteria bacterium]
MRKRRAEERRKEGNTTQRHKGTKFRKDRTKVQNRGMAIPFFRALALSLALDRREEERGIQHKDTRAQ